MKPRSLTRRSDFARVYTEGRKIVGRSCVLYMLPADDDACSVVASRKVGGAVQRNRAKRVLREMTRAVFFPEHGAPASEIASRLKGCGSLKAAPENGTGLWLVVVARRALLDLDIHAVVAEAGKMLVEHGLDAGHDAPPSPR